MGVGTSSKKACAIYSDMNELQNDINSGMWKKSQYAIIYVENLAYIYTVDGFASSMFIDNYDIKANVKNSSNAAYYTYTASKIHLNDDLRKVNHAYLYEWLKN